MIHIIAKKSYRFVRYEGRKRVEHYDVNRNVVMSVPEWVKKDRMYQAALSAGNISVIGAGQNPDLDVVDAVMAEAKGLGIMHPGHMTLDQLQRAIDAARESRTDDDDKKPDGTKNILDKEGNIVLPVGSNVKDEADTEDDGDDEDDGEEPITDKPLAQKPVKEMRAIAKQRGIPIPRGTNGEDIRKLLADNGVE